MPKINGELLVDVTVEDIQEQMNKIAYLLKGRIDKENIYTSGDISSGIQPKKIVNMADETRPITGWKIFGVQNADNFFNIFSSLNSEKERSIQPIVLSGECAFVFNNSTMERDTKTTLSFGEQVGRTVGQFGDAVTSGAKSVWKKTGGRIF